MLADLENLQTKFANELLDVPLLSILVLNAEGHILQANATANSTFNYNENELTQRTFFQLNIITRNTNTWWQQLLQHGHNEAITEFFSATGTKKTLKIAAKFNNKFGAYFISIIDITDQKTNENWGLLHTRALDSAIVGIVITDVNQPDYPIVFANDGFCKLTGYEKTEVIGKNCRFLQGADSNVATITAIRNSIAAKNRFEGEILNYKKDGTTFWNYLNITPITNENGNVTHFVGFQSDITAHKNAEKAIEEREAQYRLLIENLNAGIVVHASDTSIIIANQQASNLLGLSIEQMKGKRGIDPDWHFVWDDGRKLAQEEYPVNHVVLTKKPIKNWVFGIMQPNAHTPVWILLDAFPEFDQHQQLKQIVISFIDITERKMAEEAIKTERILLRTLVENLPDAIYTKDVFGRKLITNAADLKYVGDSTAINLIGKTDLELFGDEKGLRGYNADLEVLQTGNPIINLEEDFITKNGEKKWILTSKVPLKNEKGEITGLLGIGRDITERKRIEVALQKSENNLKTVFDNTHIGYALLDTRFNIVSFNNAMRQFAQYEVQQNMVVETNAFEYFLEAQKATMKIILQKALNGRSINHDFNCTKPNNSTRWYKLNIYPVYTNQKLVAGLVIALENITETKETALQLNQTLKEITDYKFALDESSIVSITNENGIISYVNNNFCTVSKYTREELIGQNHRIVNSGYHPKEFFKQLWATIAAGKIWKGEIKNKAKDGSFYWVDNTIVPFLNRNGKPYQYVSIRIEITNRKAAEIEINNSFALLVEQNKKLKNFSYIISHNLRSHSSNIKALTGLFDTVNSEEERKEMIGYLKTVANLLDETLYSLNNVVSIQNNHNVSLDFLPLHTYLNKAIDNYKNEAAAKDAIIQNRVSQEDFVLYNATYLENVLDCFISNSLKYSHPQRKPFIILKTYLENGKLVLEIADNGLGIDTEKNKEKIFGMYKTFHGNPDAKGLGLFVAKSQIEAMGGSVEVLSEPNVGTTFKIHFK